MVVELYAPHTYRIASPAERERRCNGCGSKASWWIPDSMYGLDVTPACDIHDWMYSEGKTQQHKDEADLAFLNNMIRIIEAKGGFFRALRRRRALKYYEAVRVLGGPAYWDHKNAPSERLKISTGRGAS